MNRLNSNLIRVLLCGLLLSSFAGLAHAQFRASVQGTVTDATGALVPEATVTLKSKETGRSQEVKTSGEGFYRLSELSPGRYTLTVEKAGFKKSSVEDLAVSAESVQGLDLLLTTGEV